MIKKAMLFFVMLICTARASEAVLGMGAKLKINNPEIELSAALFTKGWARSVRDQGMSFPDERGRCEFSLEPAQGQMVKGSAAVELCEGSSLRAEYTFIPDSEMILNALFVGTTLPASTWRRCTWEADEITGTFPLERGALLIFSGKVRELKLSMPDDVEGNLRFTFKNPTQITLLDNRQWHDNFGLRIGNNSSKKYLKGDRCQVVFNLHADKPLKLRYAQPYVIEAGKEWIVLDHKKEIEAGSALDFSDMGFTDAPAGKHGWLRVVGSNFEFENLPGVAQRFCGVNLCSTACFPTPEQSETLAERLLLLGYNSVRIHHHDNYCVLDSPDSVTLNIGQMARLDALLAACFKRGIYATTDLYVSRKIAWRQLGIDRDGDIPTHIFKMLVAVHEPAYENWAAYTRNFMNHINPYTGRRYADEPGIPLIALVNEGAMGYVNAEARRLPQVQSAWAVWLAEQRRENPVLYAAIPEKMPLARTGQEAAVVARFIADIEAKMMMRMRTFLRDELQCRALVSNYNGGFQYTTLQPVREALHDYVDDHFYMNHPNFLYRRWRMPGICNNSNPLRSGSPKICSAAFTRLANKPFTVTEYNFCWPAMYRGMAGLITGSMAALQDWSGLWRFDYAQGVDSMFNNRRAAGYFELSDDPLAQAAERAVLCLFLRSDLDVLENRAAIQINRDSASNSASPQRSQYVDPSWKTAAWQRQVATYVGRKDLPGWEVIPAIRAYDSVDPQPFFDEKEARKNAVNFDRKRGAMTVVSECTLGCFAEAGHLSAGALSVNISGAPAAIWVSSLDTQPVVSSARLLLSHLTDMQNTRATYASGERRIILARGVTPPLIRAGRAEIGLAINAPQTYEVYVLETSGRRVARIDTAVHDGVLNFMVNVAQPCGACMLYEIVRK